MEPFKPKDNRLVIDKDTLTNTLRSTLTKKKRPVKFTWQGAANFANSVFNTNPFDPRKLQRIKELTTTKNIKEKDYIDFFEDMEKAVLGGVQNIGYSFGDLITTGTDAALDTNLTEKLDKAYEDNKIQDPETLLGTVNKVLIEYGVPGGLVFKSMNRAKKILRGKKAKDANAAAKATGTTAQGSKGLVLKKESEEGLEGRDLALARFRNKLKFGAEGTIIGAGFPILGKPLGKVLTFGAKYGIMKPAGYALTGVDTLVVKPVTYLAANIPGSTIAGKKIRNASSYVIDKTLAPLKLGTGAKQLPSFDKWRMFSTTSSDPLEKRLKKLDNFLRTV